MESILDLIPYGKSNAIKRSRLEALTGFSDRKNRKLIKEACTLSKDDNPTAVLDAPCGGYYKATPAEADEAIRIMAINVKAALSRLDNNLPIKRWLEKNGGQLDMEDLFPGITLEYTRRAELQSAKDSHLSKVS